MRYGRPGTLRTAEDAALSPHGNRGERHRKGIVEWYVNEARGLRVTQCKEDPMNGTRPRFCRAFGTWFTEREIGAMPCAGRCS